VFGGTGEEPAPVWTADCMRFCSMRNAGLTCAPAGKVGVVTCAGGV
jgi:hypothetical protein